MNDGFWYSAVWRTRNHRCPARTCTDAFNVPKFMQITLLIAIFKNASVFEVYGFQTDFPCICWTVFLQKHHDRLHLNKSQSSRIFVWIYN